MRPFEIKPVNFCAAHARQPQPQANAAIAGRYRGESEMRLKCLRRQHEGQTLGCAEVRPRGRRPYARLLGALWLGGLGVAETAWAARSTAFRGEWSVGSLIGSLLILGILAALVVFLIWPRRGGQ